MERGTGLEPRNEASHDGHTKGGMAVREVGVGDNMAVDLELPQRYSIISSGREKQHVPVIIPHPEVVVAGEETGKRKQEGPDPDRKKLSSVIAWREPKMRLRKKLGQESREEKRKARTGTMDEATSTQERDVKMANRHDERTTISWPWTEKSQSRKTDRQSTIHEEVSPKSSAGTD